MKDSKTIKEFVRLRGSGLAYNKITEKIGISRQTLVKWNKKYINEIIDYERSLFYDLYARHIVFDIGGLYINTTKLKQLDEIDRLSEWEREVYHRTLIRLKKQFLKEIKSLILTMTDSGKVKEIEISFWEEGPPIKRTHSN